MTDRPTPSAEALAAADAICKRHGMLPGGYLRDSLAEDLEAFACTRETGADEAARAMLDEREPLAAAIEAADQEWDHEPAPAGTYWASLAAAVQLFYQSKHARLYRIWNDKIDAAEDRAKALSDTIEARRTLGVIPPEGPVVMMSEAQYAELEARLRSLVGVVKAADEHLHAGTSRRCCVSDVCRLLARLDGVYPDWKEWDK